MKRFFTLLAPLLFVYAVACSGGGNGPGDVVEDFNTAIAAGDSEAMLEHLEPTAREAFEPKAGMIVSLAAQQAERRGGFDGVEIVSEEIDGDNATVTYRTSFGDGTSEEQTANLRRVDGVWYMAME